MTSKKVTMFMAVLDMIFLKMASVDKKEKVKIVCILHSCLTICLLMVCHKKIKKVFSPC